MMARTWSTPRACSSRPTRSSSCASSSLALATTSPRRAAGNLTAPFSSMWTTSPGATSMPHRLTGTCTACSSWGPWPAQMPRVRYWNFIGRISWMSRDGPLLTAPTAPHARSAEVMLPPASPTLSASSGGKRCSKQKMEGRPSLSAASRTSIRLSAE